MTRYRKLRATQSRWVMREGNAVRVSGRYVTEALDGSGPNRLKLFRIRIVMFLSPIGFWGLVQSF